MTSSGNPADFFPVIRPKRGESVLVVTVGRLDPNTSIKQAGCLFFIFQVQWFKSLVLAIRLFLKAQAMMKGSAKKHFIKEQNSKR